MGPQIPPPRSVFVVSPTGDDAAPGDEARPMRTLGRALAEPSAATIVLRPGRYEESPRLDRDVALNGEAGAVVAGTVRVGAVVASIARVSVEGALVATGARRLSLAVLSVRSASTAAALELSASVAALSDVEIGCGPEACALVEGSTVSATRLTLTPGAAPHKRGLRAETSSVTLRGLRATGSSIADVAAFASHLTIRDASFEGVVGSAVAALDGSRLDVARVRASGQGRVAFLCSLSDAELAELDVGPLADDAQGLGVVGSTVRLARSRFTQAGGSAIVVNDLRDRSADVVVEDVQIAHGRKNGVQLGQGTLVLRRVTLVGDASADGDDAVSASGNTANLVIESAEIEASAGFGVGIYNDAGASIRANIRRPRQGGILIDNTAGATLAVSQSSISDCAQGSGLAIRNALEVTVDQLEVTRCPEAGVLAALGTELTVTRSRFLANRQYGVAAFGQSSVALSGSTARGSKWAAFASCADGSSIGDGGGNTLEGPTALCP